MVDATQVIQGAVFAPAHQVASAVHALAGGAKRVGQEALSSQFGALEVATGQADFATDIQLAGDADGQQVQLGIEDVQAARTDRITDRCVGSFEGVTGEGFPDQRGHHGFSRAVAVDDALRLQDLLQAFVGLAGKGFATQRPGTYWQFQTLRLDPVQQLLGIAGRQAGDGHAFIGDYLAGFLGTPQLLIADHQAAAEGQRHGPALQGAVETDRGEMQLHIVRGHAVALTDGLHMHGQAEVVHRHAFRLAGGAGGVDQVGQI